MIPHKLTLRNFMCYREDVPPLHFDGLSVVCLSGENGAGKSALLDAMTWALWGRARAKSDDDLIALGQSEMEIDFEFVLDGRLHRVIRRRSRGKRGQSMVDFQLCDEGGTWRRIGGDGVRDTDAHITAALRMSYETFINSAFLLQGRADEFTNRKPAERKQVLTDILGLGEYETYEERAKQRRNSFDVEIHGLEGVIEDHDRQVARRPFLLQQLMEAAGVAERHEAAVAAVEADEQRLRAEAERLRGLAERHAVLDQQITREARELEDLRRETAEIQLRVETQEQIVARRAAIEDGFARLRRLEQQLVEWEHLREEAYRLNDEKKQYDDALAQIRNRLDLERSQLEAEANRLRGSAEARHELQQQHTRLASEAHDYSRLREELERLRARQETLDERLHQANGLRLKRSELQRPLDTIRDALLAEQSRLNSSLVTLEKSVGRLPQIERDLQQAGDELLRLQAIEDQLATLRDERRQAEAALAQFQAQCEVLKKQGTEVKKKLELVEQGHGICPVCDQELGSGGQERLVADYGDQRAALLHEYGAAKRAADETVTALDRFAAEIDAHEKQLRGRERAQKRQASLQADQERVQDDAAALREQTRTLDVIDRQLAERDYGHGERAQLQIVERDLHEIGDPAEIKRDLDAVRREAQAHETRLRGERDLHQRLAAVEAQLRQAEEAGAKLPEVEAHLDMLVHRIEHNDYGEAERAAIEATLAAIRALGYTRDAHARLKEEHIEAQHWAEEMLSLRQAEQNLKDNRAALRRNHELADRRAGELDLRRVELIELDTQLRSRQAVELDLGQAQIRLRAARAQAAQAREELGRAQGDLARCDQLVELLEGYRGQHAALVEQRGIYDELAQAFGKKGVQAMLIETAIPEIEHEANGLLARMTDNQMHLSMDTQRDSKKGDTIETLDIRIADGLGTRDYAMFSGGEAFRVNFAVRIALSKLLARRADANLKTLVIDEGFGTQDAHGRDRIVEAINAVSNDFERIIVITHIQELKDLFPQQIEVTKGPAGSTVSVA